MPGQVRLWAWQTVAHGAEGVVHFNWRTARRGVETYWYGVLDADDVPRARFEDFKREGQEMRKVGQEILGSKVVSDVAVIKDFEAEWAFDHQFLTPEASVGAFYGSLFRAASDMRLNIDFVGPEADLGPYKIVFAPALVLMDPALAGRLKRFVANGGILIMSAHSAVRDRDNGLTDQTIPIGLTDLFGAELDSFMCYQPPSAGKNAARFADGASAPVLVFAETLKPTTARVVATWQSDYMAGAPACTENRSGKGLAAYYGSFFNLEAAKTLLARYAKEARVAPIIGDVPAEVEVTRRTKGSTSYYFLLNHANARVDVAPGGGFVDLLTGTPSPARFTLEPFGYRVLRK
jgi:beta-galactosidase